MKTEIRVPAVGESIKEGILACWLKSTGDSVREGDELFELETDKATMAVPSPADGTLEILVEEGAEVKIDQQIGWLTIEQGSSGAAAPPMQTSTAVSPAAPENEPFLSPAARRVVLEYGLDASLITGTGRRGCILKGDALRAAEQAKATAPAPEPAAITLGPADPPKAEAPVRQTEADVPPVADGGQRRVPMSLLRRRTAERLVEAKRNAAHLTTFNEIDMSTVMDLRSRYKQQFEETHDVRLGFMSFAVKACCAALAANPDVNAMIDGDDIVYHPRHSIGVAVSTDNGLVVPVVRDADTLSFAETERAIATLAEKARKRALLPDDLTGGTFSITNGGVFGSLLSTPIPAYPQTAILGMHAIQKRPVVVDDQIVIRPMMYVALTYDHRVIDGRTAIRFLAKVKELIEEPDRMLLGL